MFGDCECGESCALCDNCEFPKCECECRKKSDSDIDEEDEDSKF